MMTHLAEMLAALDWPPDRLDIQILFEADDVATLVAARRAGFASNVTFVCVPDGGPRTKPNALNYGLRQVRGEYVCIYDVEDVVRPDQLRVAYDRFHRNTDRLGCVQAPLKGVAHSGQWFAGQWALEYAVHFEMTLPVLAGLRLPILLGGTSNHFRTNVLVELGGWNAWNVTEDADLGLRLSRLGYDVTMISAPTLEAAPEQIGVWLRQRSRWLKGYMQTWGDLLATSPASLRALGPLKFISAHMSLGGAILSALLYLPLIVWVSVVGWHAELEIGAYGWAVLGLGLGLGALCDALVQADTVTDRFVLILTRPFYWPFHSLSAYLALWELIVAPHYWAKTPHRPRTNCTSGR